MNFTDYTQPYTPSAVSLVSIAVFRYGEGYIIVSATNGWTKLASWDNYSYTTQYGNTPSDPNYRIDQKRAVQLYLSILSAAQSNNPCLSPRNSYGTTVVSAAPDKPSQQAVSSQTSVINPFNIIGVIFTVAGLVTLRKK